MIFRPTIRVLYVLIFILLLPGCRKLVQDEFPDFPANPVVNSILVADSTIRVHVSLTDKLDTIQLGWVDSAEVKLYVDGQFEESLSYTGEGIYTSSAIVVPGRTYTCEVSIPGSPIARCTDSIPIPTIISDILIDDNAGMNEEGIIYPSVSFTLENDPQRKEYFEVKLNIIEYGTPRIATIIYIADPILLNEGLPLALFSDELMLDDQYTMTLNYTSGNYSSSYDVPDHMKIYPLILEVQSISYDYYTYRKQLYLYESGRYPDIIGGVVTPFSLHSNVENGYGIFAGYSAIVSDTIFPDPLPDGYNYEGY